jgi:broad specificity phosphatase PhoE
VLVNIIRRARVDEYHPEKPGEAYSVNDVGQLQAQLLATHLFQDQQTPAYIYTGTSSRHQETTDIIADTIKHISGMSPETHQLPDLQDVRWTQEALQTCYEEALSQREWSKLMARGELPFDETVSDVQQRVREARGKIVTETPSDAAVLVVTSAIPLQLLVYEELDLSLSEIPLPVDNTGIFEFTWDDQDGDVHQLNSTPHLPGTLATRDYFVSSNQSDK